MIGRLIYDAVVGCRTNNALVQAFGVNSLNELSTNWRSATLAETVAGPRVGIRRWVCLAGMKDVTVSRTGLSSGACGALPPVKSNGQQ
jgi:hypothetical protein